MQTMTKDELNRMFGLNSSGVVNIAEILTYCRIVQNALRGNNYVDTDSIKEVNSNE